MIEECTSLPLRFWIFLHGVQLRNERQRKLHASMTLLESYELVVRTVE